MLCGNSQDDPRINPTAAKGFVEIISQDNPRTLLMNPTTAYTGYVEKFHENPSQHPTQKLIPLLLKLC
jgi:hypothetical protein